ncbi:MAG: hypothetical protein JGK17_06035 [Microcoleus sp. PH2017_10_PVI_O_A]|uniref:hypothetical protein n=1 Tax=unclassified Microcoleus TaxID=2642155 RepID=UPI001D9221DA|nr:MULTISPECIES: hypothetical protein [unclassified Microcoleus]TAE84507.1 MAG: hypothetical protein EAZ83_06005 [Oscillatoriales cyanobacterium]MCC3405146.1 hypothetical protein [Microcoleus sp. PH2017_10_PVI_O_A]MCC3459232.1 hypothetical protein [Microcoleus sp. PH2017_11_PCY_U_A]MCC3477452.1 hypothetical protein [Microcoleus sp. PH2017_12_PCY_D_A]MCC3528686.1 hypothetical protein [Microcoleus sp. PH2017_21_RUC_O_A]
MGIATDLTANFFGEFPSVQSFEGFCQGDRILEGLCKEPIFINNSTDAEIVHQSSCQQTGGYYLP